MFKTDAPYEFINQFKLDWMNKNKKFDFSILPSVKKYLKSRIPRFLPNPEKNWGPK